MIGRVLLCAGAALALCSGVWAEEPGQITAQSWHGLSGLFVTPTARMIGKGRLAVGYNETKHTEFFSGVRFSDRQVRGLFTYGIADWLEVTGAYVGNQYDTGGGFVPVLDNEGVVTGSLKARLVKETRSVPEISFAIRDITDADADASPLEGLHNGRKFFLLASKRVLKREGAGRFIDAHLGLANSAQKSVSAMFGFEVAVSPSISVIAEGMFDSPFVNFRDAYVGNARGVSNVPGRFIFDTGVRFYPDVMPGLVLDLGVVGDGSFEFSFGGSYVFGL